MNARIRRRNVSANRRWLAGLLGTTILAAGAVGTTTAAEDGGGPVSEVVITGTHIQGVGAVGSVVIGVGQEEITRAGITSTADLLRTIPQVLELGASDDVRAGALFQGADLNTTGAKGLNLRGLGSTATLTLINNHRVPPQGPNLQLFDAEDVPLIAMERIEVIPDGASAIYGSDAVAGVVNYIVRRPFDGAESSASYGYAEDAQQWKVGQVVSQKWDSGGFLIAADYADRDALSADDRPNLYNDDFSAYGGSPSGTFASPGNIVIGGVSYAIPSGHATDLQLSDLGPAGSVNRENAWLGRDAIPATKRTSVVTTFEQDITPGIQFHFDALYTNRHFEAVQDKQVATITVPDTNPYSPCNASHAPFTNTLGIACTGSLTVQYSLAQDIPNIRKGYERMWYANGGVKFDLPHQWTGDVSYEHGISSNHSNNIQSTGRGSALIGVASSAPPAGVPYFNPFCDGSAGCQDPATIAFATDFALTTFHLNRDHFTANLNGPLFSLPGGDVQLAVGGEYLTDDFVNRSGGSAGLVENRTPTRKISTGFGELYIPIVGDANSAPGIQRLEFTAAGRYEHYSDFGGTFKPKLGVNYVPTNDLKIHGSFGKSFRAPSLADINPNATAALLRRTINSADITLPGYIGPAGVGLPVVAVVGGNSELGPETATTWSTGFDWRPSSLEGLTASVNYYNIKYTGKIDYPAYNAGPAGALNLPQYANYIVLNPAFFSSATFTPAEYAAIGDALVSGGVPPAYSPYEQGARAFAGGDPATSLFLLDGRRHNAGIIKTDGLDLALNYIMMTDFGDVRMGAAGNYIFNYNVADTPGAAIVGKVNHFGYPPRYRIRGQLGADVGGWSATAFINYMGSYHIDRQYIPAGASDQYLDIGSYATVDLTVTYDTGDKLHGLAGNLQFILSIQNAFDNDPPLVLNNSAPGIKFDPSYTSPLGRLITFQVTKRW